MRIAVVGWGSLIWEPRELRISSRWHTDGPMLPLEFLRVSKDGRLTLVIVDGVHVVRTLWAISGFDELEAACENLRRREGTGPKWISNVSLGQQSRNPIQERIWHWLRVHTLDAAVWTALPPRKPGSGNDSPLTVEEAVEHIRSLSAGERVRAEEYVRKAPEQIRTVIRRRLVETFGWKNSSLPQDLFED